MSQAEYDSLRRSGEMMIESRSHWKHATEHLTHMGRPGYTADDHPMLHGATPSDSVTFTDV